MAERPETQQFLQSWLQWRNSLPEDHRWMADAMAWSAAHGGDVQGYQAEQWSPERLDSWLREQNGEAWQQWAKNWQSSDSWANWQ